MLTERTDAMVRPVLSPPRGTRSASVLPSPASRKILLLQGPVGPFFALLEQMLTEHHWTVTRATFNHGDSFDARGGLTLDYRAGAEDYEGWLRHLINVQRYDAIVLFGAERPLHRITRRVGKERNIPVLCLEEGYIRSGYITAEFGGNNWQSPIAGRLPPEDNESDAAHPMPHHTPRNYDSFRAMCFHAMRYYARMRIGTSRRMRTSFHKSRPLSGECFYWARNYWRYVSGHGRNFRTVEKLLEQHDRQFFMIPLQVSDDSQLGAAARGWTSDRMIEATIASFAGHAASDAQLVYKIHPLERGHSNHRRFIERIAAEYGVADRVHTLDSGSLGLLVRHSAGMVTINSTSGFSALAHDRPLLVLGDALYRHDALAACYEREADMHAFWTAAPQRRPRLGSTYIGWIKRTSLIAGDFYVPAGQAIACKGIVELLEHKLAEEAPRANIALVRKTAPTA